MASHQADVSPLRDWPLKSELATFRRLFETAPVGQALVARDGTIVQANPAYHRLLGYPPGELVGANVFGMTHPDDLQVSRDYVSRLYSGDVDHYTVEKRYLRRDGTPVWTLLSVAITARDEGGEVDQMIGLIQDISEQKRAEAELRRSLEQLARSNAELERFAYVASHDLMNPLQTVKGFLELLLTTDAEDLPDVAPDFARRALTATERMARLIQALLDLARADTAALQVEAVDLSEVLATVLESLDAPIKEAVATVSAGPLPTVAADRDLLGVALQNLVANSLRFRHPDRPLLVHLEADEDDAGATLRVIDNGRGVPVDERERIFDAFHRGAQTRSGAGLGLATCRRVIDRHGGRIWVDDTPGGGATFTVHLPRRQPIRPPTAAPAR